MSTVDMHYIHAILKSMCCSFVGTYGDYRPTSNTSRTKFQNLNVSRPVLELSLPNPLQPGVKSRIKMQLSRADGKCRYYQDGIFILKQRPDY